MRALSQRPTEAEPGWELWVLAFHECATINPVLRASPGRTAPLSLSAYVSMSSWTSAGPTLGLRLPICTESRWTRCALKLSGLVVLDHRSSDCQPPDSPRAALRLPLGPQGEASESPLDLSKLLPGVEFLSFPCRLASWRCWSGRSSTWHLCLQ